MKRLIAIFLLISLTASANNYYFSSSEGNDSRTATEAQNKSTPWRTLNKLNQYFTNLKTGDSILFKSGDAFYGTITITKSSIAFSSYGEGAKPVMSGFAKLTNWTYLGNGIYESSAIASTSPVNLLTINNQVQRLGRYPNDGYLTYTSHYQQKSISSNQISGTPNCVGGEVVIRAIRHVLDRCTITAQTSTTVTYTKASGYTPINGYGFFFQNHISTLDNFGEWCYNKVTKKIAVYLGTNPPSNYDIQCSTIDQLITGQSRANISINNLSFEGSNTDAIYFLGGGHISITNCDFIKHGQDAINTQATTYLNILGDSISECGNNGIILRTPNGTDTHSNIANCVVNKIGVYAGSGESGANSYVGVTCFGAKYLIQNNRIDSTGYISIHFCFGDSSTVAKNYLTNYCFIKNDGGAIYTWNNKRNVDGTLDFTPYFGNQIVDNIILHAGNADEGTIYSEATVDNPIYGSHGIYLDGNSRNITVAKNTVAYNGKGIFVHDNQNSSVINNTCFNNNERQLDIYYDDLTLPATRGITIKGNLLYAENLKQEVTGFRSLRNDIDSMATLCDSNIYAQSINKGSLISARYIKSGSLFIDHYNLLGWKATFSYDHNSDTSHYNLPEYKLNGTIGSDKVTNGTYDFKTLGTICYNKTGTCNSTWVNNVLDGGCYKLSYSQVKTTTNVITSIGSVSSLKNYVLRFSLLGTKNGTFAVYLRQAAAPYDKLIPIQYFQSATSRNEYEILFFNPVTYSNAQIIFQFKDSDSTVYLDNLHFYQADVAQTNPDDFVRFEYNPTGQERIITLDQNYSDVKGNIYSGTITLQPFQSIILIKQ